MAGTLRPEGGWYVHATTAPLAEIDGSLAVPPLYGRGSGSRIVRLLSMSRR